MSKLLYSITFTPQAPNKLITNKSVIQVIKNQIRNYFVRIKKKIVSTNGFFSIRNSTHLLLKL